MEAIGAAEVGKQQVFAGITHILQNSADGTTFQVVFVEAAPRLRAIAYVDGPPAQYGENDAAALLRMARELNKLRDLQDEQGFEATFEVDESRGVLFLCRDLDLRDSCFSRVTSVLKELKRVADYWSLLRPIRLYRLFGRAPPQAVDAAV